MISVLYSFLAHLWPYHRPDFGNHSSRRCVSCIHCWAKCRLAAGHVCPAAIVQETAQLLFICVVSIYSLIKSWFHFKVETVLFHCWSILVIRLLVILWPVSLSSLCPHPPTCHLAAPPWAWFGQSFLPVKRESLNRNLNVCRAFHTERAMSYHTVYTNKCLKTYLVYICYSLSL